MTDFGNRLTTDEDRSIRFDPFGNWQAELWVHERDLKNYQVYREAVAADKSLSEKFKKTYEIFLKKYRANFKASEANHYAASTFAGYLRLFLEDHSTIDTALDATLNHLKQRDQMKHAYQ